MSNLWNIDDLVSNKYSEEYITHTQDMSEAKLTEKFFNEHFVTVEQFLVSLDTVTAQLKSETDDTNIEVCNSALPHKSIIIIIIMLMLTDLHLFSLYKCVRIISLVGEML